MPGVFYFPNWLNMHTSKFTLFLHLFPIQNWDTSKITLCIIPIRLRIPSGVSSACLSCHVKLKTWFFPVCNPQQKSSLHFKIQKFNFNARRRQIHIILDSTALVVYHSTFARPPPAQPLWMWMCPHPIHADKPGRRIKEKHFLNFGKQSERHKTLFVSIEYIYICICN